MAALRCVFRLSSLRPQFCRSPAILRQFSPSSRYCTVTETVTHTGQAFDEGDYRRLRYIQREKEVNEKFAIDLVNEEPPKEIAASSVWCDGGDPSTGHPRVYINLDKPGPHACGYCGLRYIQKAH
ncbi:NADH dehydrogenase [ubiquinone] iron-sulfur protein 6, mitochondrial-like [Acanthaster planci]|uniref:NADH dehydrogenase [ubiquinone] iron-sulfur protein 6, mitochondrial-like n=1 Tax=Acanthaster planci TaxID=133434 RepID=A0A8B7XUK3_ACAPL|nr:NADH dehydrogenase [ubiquinone] iron-sulfur protein 6, mitochondrial-like [Acanthaster planci]